MQQRRPNAAKNKNKINKFIFKKREGGNPAGLQVPWREAGQARLEEETGPLWQKGEDDEDDAQQIGPGGQSDVNVQERESGLISGFRFGQWAAMAVDCEHRGTQRRGVGEP